MPTLPAWHTPCLPLKIKKSDDGISQKIQINNKGEDKNKKGFLQPSDISVDLGLKAKKLECNGEDLMKNELTLV